MKKSKLLLLLILVLFITGCSIKKIDISDYNYLIDNIVLKKSNLKGKAFSGFSLYIPKGLNIVEKDDDNIVLRDKYNNIYYMYIDIVSYHNKIKLKYKLNSNSYYSKKINSKDSKKSGYLQINVSNNKYFVHAFYNYVKIEVYTRKNALDDTVLNTCLLLSNINYNDKIIDTMIGNNELSYKEESFNIFTKKKTNTSYLDYIEKYDSGAASNSVKSGNPDEDIIDIEIDED